MDITRGQMVRYLVNKGKTIDEIEAGAGQLSLSKAKFKVVWGVDPPTKADVAKLNDADSFDSDAELAFAQKLRRDPDIKLHIEAWKKIDGTNEADTIANLKAKYKQIHKAVYRPGSYMVFRPKEKEEQDSVAKPKEER